MTIRAAGILILTERDSRALFLQRADSGVWAFPGGGIEEGETAADAAEREAREEIGPQPFDNPRMLMRRVKADGPEEVDFTTYVARADREFTPRLNDEHTAWCWADIANPPQPLHPGAAATLARLNADELGIARLIASGDLTSPQRYGTFLLWSVRITGTGVAYRDSNDEYCFRPADVYLNQEFLDRCNGLPVIFVHPEKKPKLDSEEFNKRIVGTVFVPFVKGDEVWAVCRVYDDAANDVLLTKEFSTSPGVVFGKDSGNVTLKTPRGENLLIEGKPALLDHIALVPAGVWDKGGEPSGIDATGVTMAEESKREESRDDAKIHAALDAIVSKLDSAHSRLDAIEKERDGARKDAARRDRMDKHRKDRFGPRKDGEKRADWAARHDADETAMCDALRKDGASEEEAREDATRARRDAEEQERKDGGESFEKWAKEEEHEPEHKDDNSHKDAEAAEKREREEREEKEREDRAKHDARLDSVVTENADLKRRLAAMEAQLAPITAEDRDALASTQARADGIAGLFGKRALPPIPGEKPIEYRRRIANDFKQHSAKFKDKSLASLDADMLGMVEEQIYNDAAAAARSPERAGAAGTLIPIREPDEAGRMITRYVGDNLAWMQFFMQPSRVGRFVEPRARRA